MCINNILIKKNIFMIFHIICLYIYVVLCLCHSLYLMVITFFFSFNMYLLVLNYLNRSIHGITTQDHCLWKNLDNNFYGGSVRGWTSRDRCNLHSHRHPRSSFACCNCSSKLTSEFLYLIRQ